MAFDGTANRLGALALAVGDRMQEAAAGQAGHSDSAAAALSALVHILDRPSVDLLRRLLGLTSSGTVRLLDRLQQHGYIKRVPGRDGRETAITRRSVWPDGPGRYARGVFSGWKASGIKPVKPPVSSC